MNKLAIIVGVLGLIVGAIIGYNLGNTNGWRGCIEENNLYIKYNN